MVQIRLMPPFRSPGGRCWTIPLDPELFPETDTPGDPSGSLVTVSENGVDLGPPHTAHQLIIRDGGGAYSHWGGQLYFSTPDNSDPNENGRVYEVRRDPRAYFIKRAEHSVAITESYFRRIPGGRSSLDGARVLEIGPGRDMGTVLLLAGLGAKSVTSVDRFAGSWDQDWHTSFLDALIEVAATRFDIDVTPIAGDVKMAQSFLAGQVTHFSEPFEAFARTGLKFDVTVSHSVFEHFFSMSDAAAALFAVSEHGSIGAHHVDFRDHRSFGEPLEFLLVPDDVYRLAENNDNYGRGNRTRADEMAAMLSAAGFDPVEFTTESTASTEYLSGLAARLQASRSDFNSRSRSSLATLSGDFLLYRES